MSRRAALLKSGVGAARYRLTGHRMPLSVTLYVTARCDTLCDYCAIPLQGGRELGTAEMIALVDAMADAGAVRVGLTGGEPLVRDDIGLVVDRLAAHGIWCTLETNGHRYPSRAAELDRVGRLMIPVDGREDAHDVHRGPGAWRRAMRAIEVARARGMSVHTVTTLSAATVGEVDAVVDLAERLGCTAEFQVLHPRPFQSVARAAELRAQDDALRKALRQILEARLAGRPVGTSEKSLRYLLSWPSYADATARVPHEDVHCMAGQLYCAVWPDGGVTACGMLSASRPGPSPGGFAAAFAALRDHPCQACTSTAFTEYNYLYNLNAPTLIEWTKALRPPTPSGSGAPRRGAA
jgi:MoaA/NifB/PqqE/SkfB family radical SAM enzyme